MKTEKAKLLQELVLQVRHTEKALLDRSRDNLVVMRKALASSKGSYLVPSVLSTFSVALVVAGTFLNTCIRSSKLLTHHSETVLEFMNDLVANDDVFILAIASWRGNEAGVPMPWLDKSLAEIQAVLELFQEKQHDLVSPHLICIKKIMEISGMLTESGTSVLVAIWAYLTNSFTVAFAQNLVEELEVAIDQAPDGFTCLTACQANTEQKIANLLQAFKAFKANGQSPEGVTTVLGSASRQDATVQRIRLSLHSHIREIHELRSAIEDFDHSMSAMAQTLPSFVRSLLKFVSIWNAESGHLADPS